MIEILFIVIGICYLIFMLWLWLGWERIVISSSAEQIPCSIIIPVRNEAGNISLLLNDLKSQTYGSDLYEVIIVNDHSEDDTEAEVKSVLRSVPYQARLHSLEALFGKKAAISTGVEIARNDVIITVDADCRVNPAWLESMMASLRDDLQMVVGPVVYQQKTTFLNKCLTLEFASLVGTSASTLGWGKPSMSNGANLLFRKPAYQLYEKTALDLDIPSGDDMFLMHAINREYPGSVQFCKKENAVVETSPPGTFTDFVSQRQRWAGKWSGYRRGFTKNLAVIVYLFQLVILAGLVLAFLKEISWSLFVNIVIAKALFEFFYLRQIMSFLARTINPVVFLFLQVLYPPYVVITGLLGFTKGQKWKNRPIT